MKLSKKGIPYRAARNLGVLGFFFLFSGGTSINTFNLIAAVLLATALVLVYSLLLLWEYLVWRRFDYFIQEDSVKITKGVFRRQEREIPFRRIQNVDVKRNIVHRVLGIAKIDLETAGGKDTEASLRYVDEDEVEDVRNSIKHGEKTGEKDSEQETGDSIYRISDRNLVILSATDLDARIVFVLLAGFGFFSAGIGAYVDSISVADSAIAALLLIVGALVVFISNFVRNFEKYYGFRLWRSENSLKYERGLLNRQEGTIPLEKVQSLGLVENFLKRFFGYSTLKIETAGYSGQKAVKQGAEAAIPLAERQEVIEYAEQLGELDFPEMNGIPERARNRYFVRYKILSLLVSGASLVMFSSYAIAGAVLASGAVLSAVAAHLKWRHRGYAEGEENLFARNRFWNRRTDVVPYYRIQNLIETRTFFQRRWNLASLTFDTAGSTAILDNPVVPDLDTEELEDLKESVYSRFQESLR
ncbi:MAG: PH domain-containing protein [Candidatus Nanosalina sp.]